MTHENKIASRYRAELGGSLLLYTVILFFAIRFGAPMQGGTLKTAVMVSPVIPVLLMVWAIARQFSRSDEYIRLQMLQNIALSYAVTVAVSITYGFLENAGFPRLTMFAVPSFMGGALFVFSMIRGSCAR